jgi:poly-beta-1,6-N-acetyl-D-glucosamine biosynthesis protein PgaD
VTELIINAPHLQTARQRLAAVLINLFGWLLWSYFIFPLVSLGCWYLDFSACSQWVNLSGGYLNLRETLLVYIETVAAMILVWLVWVVYNRVKRRRRPPMLLPPPVSRAELCRMFQVSKKELKECQESAFVVVHFDQHGHIIGLKKGQGDLSLISELP